MKEDSCGIISAHIWEMPYLSHTDKNMLLAEVEQMVLHLMQTKQISHFIVPMQLGLSMDTAQILLRLRKLYPITLECIIPYEEQHISWGESERNQYFSTIAQCNIAKLLQAHFTIDCYQRSMDYMISSCKTLLFFRSEFPCDANDAFVLATKKNRSVLFLPSKN